MTNRGGLKGPPLFFILIFVVRLETYMSNFAIGIVLHVVAALVGLAWMAAKRANDAHDWQRRNGRDWDWVG